MFHLLMPYTKFQAIQRARMNDIENQLTNEIENTNDPRVKNALQKYLDYILLKKELDEINRWWKWW